MTFITKFIPVDPDNLPDEEVLAIGYQDEMLVGYLHRDITIECESDAEILTHVTAYIPLSQLVELYKQQDED